MSADNTHPGLPGLRLVTTGDPRSARLVELYAAVSTRLQGRGLEQRHEPGEGAPHFVLPGEVRFCGGPDGHEAGPFLDAVSGRLPSPPPALLERVATLRMPAAVRLYVSGRCTFCPQAVRSLIPLAAVQPLLQLTVIDAELFPELAAADRVQALPTLVIDGRWRWSGTIDAAEVIGLLADRDPAAIGPAALESILKEGRAREVAAMMHACGRIFPALVELLVHDQWPVRLGAMVSVEELAALDSGMAHAVLDLLWDRFAALSETARGDILYLAGETGRPSDIERIRRVVVAGAADEVREAAEEAIVKLRKKD